MWWGSAKTHCRCNGSHAVAMKVQECVPSKRAYSPVITAAVKSTCGARRMFVSAIVLIFLLAAIYWISLPHRQMNPEPCVGMQRIERHLAVKHLILELGTSGQSHAEFRSSLTMRGELHISPENFAHIITRYNFVIFLHREQTRIKWNNVSLITKKNKWAEQPQSTKLNSLRRISDLISPLSMINLPYNATSMSRITPYQSVPVQTSQYNFPTCQQPQTSTQQMQTAACGPCSGISQGPFAQVYQPETYVITHQCTPGAQPVTNPCHPAFQRSCNPPPSNPSCAQLPQNILDQIRACVSNAAPIFILPGNCQQSPALQQQQQQQQQAPLAAAPPQTMTSLPTTAYPPSGLTYPAACYPPPFYSYPVPLPYCDPFIRAREITQSCGCCRGRDVDPLSQSRSVARTGCHYDVELDEHRCTPTTDDTICSKRTCPSSLHLQALASQFLSMQGIVACAATRLVLRKVPGSNVTTTMEDTMAKAQRAINALTKDQLLTESRNAQQVNALINLHMTANPPPNVVPILTLVQLKMNLLKAQIEGLVNQRLMETQGVGVEVETDLIDPMILALKSDAELRDFLSALRRKECDERVNVNFAPYRSQRAIAETRLSNVQNKIRQVEAEFDRRRCAMLPAPTLSSRIVQQFSGPCYSARFEDPRRLYSSLPSADLFAVKPCNPKKLLLKPCVGNPEAAAPVGNPEAAGAVPQKTTRDGASRVQERSTTTDQCIGVENCVYHDKATSENGSEAKKKLRSRIVEIDATVNDISAGLHESVLARLTSDICATIGMSECQTSARKWDEISDERHIPYRGSDARRWIMIEAYVNIVDDESMKTESRSNTIMLSEKTDAEVVCESCDAIATRRIMDVREKSEGPTDLRQLEEQAQTEIVKGRVNVKKHDLPTGRLQNVTPSETEREEVKITTTAEVVEDSSVSNTQETELKSTNDKYTSSPQIVLKMKKEEREDEEKDKDATILPVSENEIAERSTSRVSISKSKKKIRFHILLLLTNIVHDRSRKYEEKWKTDEKKIMVKNIDIDVTSPNIVKLHKYSSTDNFPINAIALNKFVKDHSKHIFPKKRDHHHSKFYVDNQCQTIAKIERGKKAPVTLLRADKFLPLKNLYTYVTLLLSQNKLKRKEKVRDNEKNGDTVGTYPRLVTKAGITKHLLHSNGATKNTLGTRNENNVLHPCNVECEESFISDIFSIIGKRVIALVNKILILNKKSLYSNRNEISHKSLNNNISRKAVPICNQSGSILKDYDPLADTLHYSVEMNQGTSKNVKDFCDASLLRISNREEYDRIHQIKYLIVENKENGTKYLWISTPNHKYDPVSIHDLEHPYRVEKSFLIRSRLKNSPNSQNHPHPFSFFKHTRKDIPESDRARPDNVIMIKRRKVRELKSSDKFWILSKTIKINKSNSIISEEKECSSETATTNPKRYSNDSKERTFYSHFCHDIENTFVKQKDESNDEIVINIYDYFETMRNMNICI